MQKSHKYTLPPAVKWLALLLLGAYFLWELYWYNKVGLAFIKWHTHLAVYAFVGFFIQLISCLVPIKQRAKFLAILLSITFTLLLVEIILLLSGITNIYLENRNGIYQSALGQRGYDVLWHYETNGRHDLQTPEYNYDRPSNSFGFSDVEFVTDTSKILIQTYGDSFTEGDGAHFDSSYPAVLRTLLGEKFLIQNFGVCGNDPGFYTKQFDSIGSKFNPDYLVLCYGTFDFTADFFSRGGLERFHGNIWVGRKGPWWEIVYGISHVSRLFFSATGYGYKNFFTPKKEKAKTLLELREKWNAVFAQIIQSAEKTNTKILLIKKPERHEIEDDEYNYDFTFFENYITQFPNVKHYDLLPYYRQAVLVSEEGTANFYWKNDGHHNAAGYAVMAKAVDDALKKSYPEIFSNLAR